MSEDRILDKLERIEEQGRDMLVGLTQVQEQVKAVPDHETRIRALERWRWGLVGASMLLTTGFTVYANSRA